MTELTDLSSLREKEATSTIIPPKNRLVNDDISPGAESEIDDGYLAPIEPHKNGFEPSVRRFPDVPTPDVNIYQQKKTLAQGMMDLALLSANANQLRSVLESKKQLTYYYTSLSFICISLTLQVGVGVMLIWNSKYNVKRHEDMCRANRINNLTVISIFIVTITNVFISVFAVNSPEYIEAG